ncbi:MAG: hypothetical protein IT168_30175 [Bryobacterales bacterium]|nr:hypothetical protein [Bryobacterales bacterium]
MKLSTEAAEAISLTPVIAQDMRFRDLFDLILALTGKQPSRIRDLIARGTIVSGASRFRWQGWQAELADIEQLLTSFPDSDPSRPFNASACTKAILRASLTSIEIPREAGSRRRFLRRSSFWDTLMAWAAAASPAYIEYSYRERADRYRIALGPAERGLLMDAAKLLAYSTVAAQISRTTVDSIELLATRG